MLSKDQTQYNHVGHVLEDVLRHRAPRPLDEHADAHQDAVEKVMFNLEKEKFHIIFFTKNRYLWKSPGATNESYQASLNVVVDNGGGSPVLQQEHQVAVVEVVSLVRVLSVLLICLYVREVSVETKKCTLMTTLPACLTKTALCRSSREALLPPSFKKKNPITPF